MDESEKDLIKQQMLDLKKELEENNDEKSNIKNMTYLKDVNLMLGNKEQAILIEKELENKEKEYELYLVEEKGFKKISEYDKNENKLKLTDEYVEGELEKAGINQKLDIKLDPEEIVQRAESTQELEEIKEKVSKEEKEKIEEAEQKEEMNQDEIETLAIQNELGIDLVACYKVEDEQFADDVLGRETGEDHYIAVEKGTGRHVIISGNTKSGFHENQEVNSSIGGGEASDVNSSLVIKDKNNKPVMAIDSKNGNFYALEEDEDKNITPRRIDTKPMNVAEKEKYTQKEEKSNKENKDEDENENEDEGFTPGPDMEERTYGPKY